MSEEKDWPPEHIAESEQDELEIHCEHCGAEIGLQDHEETCPLFYDPWIEPPPEIRCCAECGAVLLSGAMDSGNCDICGERRRPEEERVYLPVVEPSARRYSRDDLEAALAAFGSQLVRVIYEEALPKQLTHIGLEVRKVQEPTELDAVIKQVAHGVVESLE